MSQKETRRVFLKQSILAAVGTFIPPEAASAASPETASPPLPEWPELSPVTLAGAQYLGRHVQENQTDNGLRTNEIRTYQLPTLVGYPDHTPVLLSQRVTPTELVSDPYNSKIIYDFPRLLLLPRSESNHPPTIATDGHLDFGSLRLDYQVPPHLIGETAYISSCDFYHRGSPVASKDLAHTSLHPDVRFVGDHPHDWLPRPINLFRDSYRLQTATGIQKQDGLVLVFEDQRNQWASTPLPESQLNLNADHATLVKFGDLTVVKGLTAEPFSVLSQSEVPDSCTWYIRDTTADQLHLFTHTFFDNTFQTLRKAVTIDPQALSRTRAVIDQYSQNVPVISLFVRSSRKSPYDCPPTSEYLYGQPVRLPEHDHVLVASELDTDNTQLTIPIPVTATKWKHITDYSTPGRG